VKPVIRPLEDLLPIDDLDQAIVKLSARINAATYELLVLIRQFDERAGWLKWGLGNCAEWLHYRCDLSMNAAREKVRVAHALKTLPNIAAAFATGELSYSKVRAMTRVMGVHNEDELLSFALQTTTACVEERCRELKCGTADSLGSAQRAFASRSLRIHRNAERGTMSISIELPMETGELVEKALDKARDDSRQAGPRSVSNVEFVDDLDPARRDPWSVRQADAMVSMVGTYLSGNDKTGHNSSDDYLVTIHVDQSALAAGNGRSNLPIESVKRLCSRQAGPRCDGQAVVIGEDEKGEPLNIGRKTRTVPTAIKRALQARDKNCAFPGCQHSRFVDAHHIKHWSAGGETSLDNLMLLCSQHHKLVHEGGFTIERDYQNHWFFQRPDGRAVPACGYHAGDITDDDIGDVSRRAGPRSELFNNPPAGGLLTAADNFLSEPPPPAYWH
jgi:5-methylcytosine-specific restriction endonuclease McrA